jgi:tetratricopeptide (TPR) repeat protein
MKRMSSKAKQPRPTGDRPANVASAPNPNGTGWLWPVLVLIAIGAAVYANSLWGVFLFDDAYAIVDNLRIRQLFPVDRWLATERPVVELSLAVNYAVGQLSVVGYHVFNLVVHIAAALTLFGLVRRTLEIATKPRSHEATKKIKPASDMARSIGVASGSERMGVGRVASAPRSDPQTPWFAIVVAMIWLVHPLQTESVTYVIQRAESLMGLFYLLTIYLFVRGAQSARSWRWYLASIAACALGMAGKAVMATSPVMVLLYDRFFLAGTFREAWRRRGVVYLGMGLTWGVLFACGVVQHVFIPATDRTAIGFGFKGISPWEYALTQTGVILHYLRLSLWPHPLCLDYAWPVAHHVGQVIVPAVVIVGLLLLTLWAFVRKHWIGFTGAWLFLILAPTSSVIPVRDVAFEHRMYLPLAAVIVVMFAGIRAVWSMTGRRYLKNNTLRQWVEAAFVMSIVVLLGSCTVRRNRDYHDDLGMWNEVAEQRPDNARAHVNIGVLLEQEGKVEEAIAEYRIALAVEPDYSDAHFNLGVALVRLNRVDEAEQAFRDAIRLLPGDAPAHVNLANLLYRRSDWDAAMSEYADAVRIAPHDQGARLGLARTLAKKTRYDEAIAEYRRLLQIAPNSAVAHLDMANAYIRKGDFPTAIKEFREAARLDPTDVISRINLGTALNLEEKTDEAIAAFHDALRLDPNHPDAHFNLAEALLDQGKPAEAIDEYRQILRVRPSDAGVYVAIGRALLRAERLDEAVAQFRQALVLDPNHQEAKQALDYALSIQNK